MTIENGVIVSSQEYTNTNYGTVHLNDVTHKISPEFDLSNIPAPKGRVTVRTDACKFSKECKVTEWSVEFLRGDEDLSESLKEKIVVEINRVFNLFD